MKTRYENKDGLYQIIVMKYQSKTLHPEKLEKVNKLQLVVQSFIHNFPVRKGVKTGNILSLCFEKHDSQKNTILPRGVARPLTNF